MPQLRLKLNVSWSKHVHLNVFCALYLGVPNNALYLRSRWFLSYALCEFVVF